MSHRRAELRGVSHPPLHGLFTGDLALAPRRLRGPPFPPCAPTNARHRSPLRPLGAAGRPRVAPDRAAGDHHQAQHVLECVDVLRRLQRERGRRGRRRRRRLRDGLEAHAGDAHPDGFDDEAVHGGGGAAPRRERHDLARRAGGAACRRLPRAAAAVRERAGDLRAAVPADGILPHEARRRVRGHPQGAAGGVQLLPAVPALPRQRDGGHPAEGDAPRAVGRPASDRERHVPPPALDARWHQGLLLRPHAVALYAPQPCHSRRPAGASECGGAAQTK